MSNRYGLSIRSALAADAEGLVELLSTAGVPVTKDRLAQRVTALLAQPGAVLIAEEWGPPTGVIVAHWRAELTADLRIGAISALLVDPARRRNGVARLLLKAASQAARAAGCGELILETAGEANDLRAFALATGFESRGESFMRPLRKRG